MRFATPTDLPAFDEMLRHYLLEEQKNGSPVRLTRRTLDFYRDLAWAYTTGTLAGVLVFAEQDSPAGPQPIGFVLAGEAGLPPFLETTHGKTATVWLIFVAPEHRKEGLGLGMLSFGEPRLLELGFEIAAMTFREGNESGEATGKAFGAKRIETFWHYQLGGTDHGRRIQAAE